MINFVLKPTRLVNISASSLREDNLRAYECAYFVTHRNKTATLDIMNVARYATVRRDIDAEAYINFSAIGARKVYIPAINISAINAMYNSSAPVNASKNYFSPYQDGVQLNSSNGQSGDSFNISNSNFELSCYKLINKTLPIGHSYSLHDLETLLFDDSSIRRQLEEDLEITPPNDPSALDSSGRSTRNSNHEESVEDMNKSFRADASPSKSSYEDSQVERDTWTESLLNSR